MHQITFLMATIKRRSIINDPITSLQRLLLWCQGDEKPFYTVFFFPFFFFLPFLLAGSAVALRVSRQFMTRVLPEMDEMLCIYCCELVLVSQTKSFQQ